LREGLYRLMGDLPVGHVNGPSGNEAWPNFCPSKDRGAGKAACPMHPQCKEIARAHPKTYPCALQIIVIKRLVRLAPMATDRRNVRLPGVNRKSPGHRQNDAIDAKRTFERGHLHCSDQRSTLRRLGYGPEMINPDQASGAAR
jgi:hypothetical protein